MGDDAPVRVAINGFGRIGRTALRLALDDKRIEVVAINDLADSSMILHQLKYDSTHGVFPGQIALHGERLVVNVRSIRLLRQTEPEELPWFEEGVDIVIEATGRFTSRAAAAAHLRAGARRVVISAPSADADISLVLGVNHHQYDPLRHTVISNASCTTNGLAPLLKVLDDTFGIRKGFMTTVHPYTNNQSLLDSPHPDLRRARASALSMIPTTTSAIRAVIQVMPELAGRIDGLAIRVPTAAVADIDLAVELEQSVDSLRVNDAFRRAARGSLKGIIGVTDEPLVSADFRGIRYSAVLDASCTRVVGGNLVKLIAWYDNETGYSGRLIDLISLLGAVSADT